MKLPMKVAAMLVGCIAVATASAAQARVTTTLPRETVMAMVTEEAAEQGVPAALALAVAETGAHFETLTISDNGARGVMQLIPSTARDLYGLKPYQLFDPQKNIRAGVTYLGELIELCGREDLALSHYRAGLDVHQSSGHCALTPATRQYVNRVLNRRHHYERTAANAALDPEVGLNRHWREEATRELAFLDKERLRVVTALRALARANDRRSGKG